MVRIHRFSPLGIANLVLFLIISEEPQIGKKKLITDPLIQQAGIPGQLLIGKEYAIRTREKTQIEKFSIPHSQIGGTRECPQDKGKLNSRFRENGWERPCRIFCGINKRENPGLGNSGSAP
jgi:hypothetical protein